MTDHAMVIAGGGPTGLMLAAELTLAGTDAVIIERRASQELDGSRAGGLLPRTIEVLDQRGVAERFLSAGQLYPSLGFAQTTLDVGDCPTRHNYVLGLWQSHIERILAEWVAELRVPIRRSCEVVGFAQDESGVSVELSDGDALRADYLVGCDGGRSLVRKVAGIDFPGWDPTKSWMIAEVEMDEEPEFGFRHDSAGSHAIGRRQEGEPIRLVLTEREADHSDEPDMDELRQTLIGIYGTDFGLRSASWISRFSDMTRQAASYRSGRVLLAGDAAHIHPPQGGQGLGTGVQDAVNLGWKLAQVIEGTSSEELLDTYHAERHPVGARVLRTTMAQVALAAPDDRHQALRDVTSELLAMDEPRRHVVAMLSALDIRYDFGEGHPLLGRRMPDLDLRIGGAEVRLFTLLHEARGVLLTFGAPASVVGVASGARVRLVDAAYLGRCVLPGVGEVPVPPAVLLRPDGHVAWTGDVSDPALAAALARWFGAAAAA